MIRALTTAASALALGACSLAPAYERPATPVPPSWPVGDAYLRQSEAALPAVSYRDIFRDPRLQRIIESALANNRDLRAAAANIAIARAQYRIQRADRLPNVTAGATAGIRRGTSQGTTGTGTSVSTGGGVSDSYSADVGVTAFELDLFGRVASLSRAALNDYFATEAAARATRLTLVSDIADAWLTYASDRSLMLIAENTSKSAMQSVRLTRLRLEGGIVPRTDLRQAELVLAQANSDLAEQRTALAQDANLLRLLVGADVDATLLPASIESVETTLAELPAGLDSGVLLRRPDVVQAEYSLRSANAQIGAARAALFPRISLTGLLGVASGALGSLFSGDAFTWSASAGADYNIFNAGAGREGVLQSRAQRDLALANYEKAIQTAFREVSDALARRGTVADQARAQIGLVASAQDNYALNDLRYRGGIDTFLNSLDAQRSLYNAQRSLVATRLVRAQNLVDLYRTIGGDALLDATTDGPRPLSPEPTATPVPRTR
ncbi:efflux transporter outer membrane subunit [Sphingomonas donggukensis]|uniref:Efflux transporter outer membrane subunit n=1 Tax=Sphingomonas donggukensis TaxID=2949093 RepID=A0ABY4TWA3_9SPHN|nr:efflux transporter outer membrane subunit [Sphingomonas donggukensis]URW76694.1 efflux transporter outer membrane subunit [Sphingomonas donggukensis]